ncbi:MAG: C13 family peptidase [Nitrosomonas sp.]|nr:C13 family peptidase [Nitrosomonas sp.]
MELGIEYPEETKKAPFVREFYALFSNLYCGVKLLCFRRSAIEQAVVSFDQIFLLICLYGLTVLITSYLITPYPVFDTYGLEYLSVELLITFLIGFALAKLAGEQGRLSRFLILVYSISPFLYVVVYAGLPHLPDTLLLTGYLLYMVWIIGVIFFMAYMLLDRQKSKAAFIVALWLAASYSLASTSLSFWYEGYNPDETFYEDYDPINQEQVYYNQFALLSEALKPIKPGVAGTTDLFFVGFGSDASQDVFMKEVGHVQRFMDQSLGTTGRSIALINNSTTIDTVPLASSTNLKFSLNHLGEIMDRDEDVVFLYLTSHGSQDHDFSVNMWPLDLNDLRPESIKDYLDNAGIRWRIILISACYSGGFIDTLKDEYSLILTASATDKTSFGCSNENEFTYFGEALFKNAKAVPYPFIASFEQAMAEIRERELSENLPPSEPQLFVGSKMKERISLLEQDMSQYNHERFSGF